MGIRFAQRLMCLHCSPRSCMPGPDSDSAKIRVRWTEKYNDHPFIASDRKPRIDQRPIEKTMSTTLHH
jgi:hypothetical protein